MTGKAAEQERAPAPVTQTATGHNIIQQVGSGVARIFDIDVNVSLLGGLVVGGSIVLLAAVVGYVSLRAPPLEPIEGPGLKVAVAPLAGPQAAGMQVADFVTQALRRSLPDDDFTIAGPARVRERPADPEEADRLAQTLLADLLLYGGIREAPGPAGAVFVDPRVLVTSQGARDSLPLVLDGAWGPPIAVVPDALSNVGDEVVSSLSSLVPFVGAVGALAADSFEVARARLHEARRAVVEVGDPGLVATVETLAGWVELRAASTTQDPVTLPSARERFRTALDHDPGADLAGVGLVAADYVEVLGDADAGGAEGAARDRLTSMVGRFDAVAAESDDPFATVMARALAAQGLLATVTDGDGPLAEVQERLSRLLASLPDVEQRAWGLFESFIHEKLGFVSALSGDVDAAVDHYRAAVERATPYWGAFYLAAVGRLELDRNRACAAADAFAAAAATAQGRFPDDAATYRTWGGDAATRCDPG